MKIFKSKHYPKVMYLFLIVSILLILFSFVSILETANDNIKQRSLTGHVIENNETNQSKDTADESTNAKDSSKKEVNSEIYNTRPYIMFYLFLTGILIAIVLTFMILSNTVKKDIKIEEEERSSIFIKD